ncbi:MAG: polyprenyl synthetase family protein, partial [Planctomycetota bacterium]
MIEAIDASILVLIEGRELPARLRDAMVYAALGPGKRVRPVLCVRSAWAVTGDVPPAEDVFTAAAALEMIHAFSLVHDDLPAMDDDDLRRGRPTLHKQFDEATAVLA